jgi:hypothetical protein
MCPHGGAAPPSGFAPTVLIEGTPAINQLAIPIAGCPMTAGSGSSGSIKAGTGSHHVFQLMPPCTMVMFQPAHPAVLAEGKPIAGTVGAVTIATGAPPIIMNHPVTVMIG